MRVAVVTMRQFISSSVSVTLLLLLRAAAAAAVLRILPAQVPCFVTSTSALVA
jgi:hypothetical protein